MAKLTADAVQDLVKRLLFKDGEITDDNPPDGAVKAEGIPRTFAFHAGRLSAAKPEIDALLAELPDNFQRDKGGGWSFLNACMDRHGEQWGEHSDIEMLICLGIAAQSATWLMKDMASALPGGMPYVAVYPNDKRAAA